jgi:hypothetical protein
MMPRVVTAQGDKVRYRQYVQRHSLVRVVHRLEPPYQMVYPVFLFIYSSVWDWYTRMTKLAIVDASTLLDIDDEFS